MAEETVTLEPIALSVAGRLALVPTATLPKFRAVGVTFNWPAGVPLPDSEIASGELEASETTEMLPLALPVEVGANAALNVKLCPKAKVRGRLNALTLNPEPLTVACDTVMSEFPELVSVSDWVALLPICTLPKLLLNGLALSCDVFAPPLAAIRNATICMIHWPDEDIGAVAL